MSRTFSAEQVWNYLCMRWRFLAIACTTAFVVAVLISLIMTRQYTATVSIVIDPPASSDPRAATAISPIYLESLRTYETYAEGDSLFAEAVERFHLRVKGDEAVETLKRRILRVNKLKDSKILQIRITLPDPAKAVQVAQFISREVVRLSQQAGAGVDRAMRETAEQEMARWQSRYNSAVNAQAEFQARTPVESLQMETDSLRDSASRALQNAMEAEADSEEYAAREKSLAADPRDAEELRHVRQEAAARKARATALQRQARDLQNSVSAKTAELSRRIARLAILDAELTTARAGREAEEKHIRDIQSAAGGRGEVLTIIDPGFLPQRPSSPNVLLNAIVAVFVALVASLFYLVFSFGREQHA
jgi:capsular polysaccharide biosynthesis protein